MRFRLSRPTFFSPFTSLSEMIIGAVVAFIVLVGMGWLLYQISDAVSDGVLTLLTAISCSADLFLVGFVLQRRQNCRRQAFLHDLKAQPEQEW